MEAAKKGIVTPEMETVAKKENMDVNELMALVAAGQVAIPANVNHTALSAEGIGKGLKTKIFSLNALPRTLIRLPLF